MWAKSHCKKGSRPQSYLELILVRFCPQILTTCEQVKQLWIGKQQDSTFVKTNKSHCNCTPHCYLEILATKGDTQDPH